MSQGLERFRLHSHGPQRHGHVRGPVVRRGVWLEALVCDTVVRAKISGLDLLAGLKQGHGIGGSLRALIAERIRGRRHGQPRTRGVPPLDAIFGDGLAGADDGTLDPIDRRFGGDGAPAR